jgi:hypothetical protein
VVAQFFEADWRRVSANIVAIVLRKRPRIHHFRNRFVSVFRRNDELRTVMPIHFQLLDLLFCQFLKKGMNKIQCFTTASILIFRTGFGLVYDRHRPSCIYFLFFLNIYKVSRCMKRHFKVNSLLKIIHIKFYSQQPMHFLIQLCISLLSYIKIT